MLSQLGHAKGWGVLRSEWKFLDGREFRFDYAWPYRIISLRLEDRYAPLALEVDGGTWREGGGAHRGKGFLRDIEKLNESNIAGWIVMRCTPQQCEDGSILDTLRRLP